jgi:hypothetical protein
MKKFYALIFLLALIACVKKKQEEKVLNAMTNGQWKVTSFIKGNADLTSDFAVYQFQFKTNNTVDAINNGTVEKTGSWQEDVNAQTITSNFANAANPLALINGTWQITNNSWTWVEAKQTVNNELLTLRLDKL